MWWVGLGLSFINERDFFASRSSDCMAFLWISLWGWEHPPYLALCPGCRSAFDADKLLVVLYSAYSGVVWSSTAPTCSSQFALVSNVTKAVAIVALSFGLVELVYLLHLTTNSDRPSCFFISGFQQNCSAGSCLVLGFYIEIFQCSDASVLSLC